MELGAMNMLKNLVHSKHKMISMGSAAALKNLLSAMPALGAGSLEPVMTLSGTKPDTPGLHMRRQRALENELEQQNLTETCDNMESPQVSPTESPKLEIHAKPKHSPAVASLLSSSGPRMTSSLRGQLPVDPVHVHCHPGNQGNASAIHASFEGITDKKRVQEILHRSNKLLADRQSPVVCDPVAPGIRDIPRIAGSSLDIMTGSHSQFQDVKMMHSFSSYCEPTASTSPETSPVDKQMTDNGHTEMAASWLTKRFHRQPSSESLRQTEGREGLHVPEATLGEVKGQPSSGLFIKASKARLANNLSEEKELNSTSAEFESESSSNGNAFSQNRLSIAGCENIFSFESEDTVPVSALPHTTGVLRKEPSSTSVGEDNDNVAACSSNDDEMMSEDYSAARQFDCASVFSFESSQSRMGDMRAEDSGEGKSLAQDVVSPPIWETETNVASSVGSPQLDQETREETELQIRDSVLTFDRIQQHQMTPKCRYVEKFMKRVSSSGDNADECHTSPDSLLSPDTYEGKSSSPGFRRLSSSSNYGSGRDDTEPTLDTDVVSRQELPRLCSDADSVVVDDVLDQEEAAFDLRRLSNNTETPLDIWQKQEDECFPLPDVCTNESDDISQQDIQTETDERFPTPPPLPLVSPISQAIPHQIASPPVTPQKKASTSLPRRKIPHIKPTPPMTLPQATFHEAPAFQITSPREILHRMMSCELTPSHATPSEMTSSETTCPQMTSSPTTPQKSSPGITPNERTSLSRHLPQITKRTDEATVAQMNFSPSMTSPTNTCHKLTSPPLKTSPKKTPNQKMTHQPLNVLLQKQEGTARITCSDQITEASHESKVQENLLIHDDRNANHSASDIRVPIDGILHETTANCISTREPRHTEDSLLVDSPLCDVTQLGEEDFDDEVLLVDVGFDDKTEVEMVDDDDDNLLETSLLMPGAEPRGPFFVKDARCGMIGSLQSTGDSVVDIMNESFPDLSSSLISDMATSHEDMLAADANAKQEKFSSHPASSEKASFDLCKVSSTFKMGGDEATNAEDANEMKEADDFELVDAMSDLEYDVISMEQERALEENASLILSELERTTMLESGMSETRLLECETLSLVSNDDEDVNNLSDGDVSEASCSLSVTSSVARSEPISERSSNTYRAGAVNVARPAAGPRIVKPTAAEPVKQQQGKDLENGPKAIRGRRKALYSAVKNKPAAADPNPVKTVKPVAAKPQVVRKQVVTATQSKPVSNSGSAKPVKPVIARSGGPKMINQPVVGEVNRRSVSHVNRSMTPASSGAQNKTRAPSLPNERKPISYNRQTRSAPVQTRTTVATDRADNTRQLGKKPLGGASDKTKQVVSAAADKERPGDESSLADYGGGTVDQDDSQDRPKPPIKQDTFVKDAPSSFSVMVIDDAEDDESTPTGRQKDKESDTVSRSSIDSFGKTPVGRSGGSQSIRRPVAGPASSTPKPGLRQAKSDALAVRRNPVSDSQANRARASSAVSSTASSTTKAARSSTAEGSTKATSFPKRPTNSSSTTKQGSNSSMSSVGKASRSGSAHTYNSRSTPVERVSSVSPAPKFARAEKTPRDKTYRKTSAVVDSPAVVASSERSVSANEEIAEGRNNSKQLVRLLNKRQGVAAGSGSGVPTLTRSSTYDKLTDDDHVIKDEQSEVLEDSSEKGKDRHQPEEMVTEIDPRRLTRVVESKFGLPNGDEDSIKGELSRTTKSQDREELTLELESPQVSITDSLYGDGQGLALDRSTVSDHVFERRDEPRPLTGSPEDQIRSFTRPSMNSRSSSTLPASFFSQSRMSPGMASKISPQTSPSDDVVLGIDGKSARKALRYKEGRKLGFGLWKRNNSSKDKPEEDDKTQQLTHDAKLGSPVRKVFGWFRRGTDSSKKNSTSKIPAPESNRSNETSTLDNCRTRTSDVNSNQTRNGDFSRRATNFLPERQVGLSSVRANSPLRAAIVQPFNYKPVHSSAPVRGLGVASEIRNEPSLEPMTKTEMLLARRRKSRAVTSRDSVISDDNLKVSAADHAKKLPSTPNSKDAKSGFLVTSV